MAGRRRIGLLLLGTALLAARALAAEPAPSPAKIVASIDLSKPFATRSPWRFTVSQEPDMRDETWPTYIFPGELHPCISKDRRHSCSPDLSKPLRMGEPDGYDEAHFLQVARIVRPAGEGGRALLLLRVAGLYGGDGSQRIGTQLLAYDRARDRFVTAFAHVTGRNNNQEVRYIAAGPLRGAVIVAEPTYDAPFGYWITVHRLDPGFRYRRALRYRSATTYGDGNPLAVIDSEMPNIQRRLGLWRPGRPLPLPARGCAHPRLVHTELWCG